MTNGSLGQHPGATAAYQEGRHLCTHPVAAKLARQNHSRLLRAAYRHASRVACGNVAKLGNIRRAFVPPQSRGSSESLNVSTHRASHSHAYLA